MSILNQYSYVVFSSLVLLALVIIGIILQRHHKQTARWQLVSSFTVGLVILLASGFFALRPGFSSVNSVAATYATIQNNRPTLLQFYSNYCIGCMSVEAVLNELEPQIATTHDVLRIDIHTEFGRKLRDEFGFSYTPEFILFDANGIEIWRGHHLPPENVLEATKQNNLGQS